MSVDASSHSHSTGSLWLSISLRPVRSIPARRPLIRSVLLKNEEYEQESEILL